jgi:hypothetical protein
METIFDEPVWQVRGFKYDGDEQLETFRGPRAFNDATDCFARMKVNAAMWELWLVRQNVSDSEFRERIRRNTDSEWEQISYGAPTELPPGLRAVEDERGRVS